MVENYCKAYHLPFIHSSLNTCSQLEDHYNILDNHGFAGQGTTAYQPQINSDGCHFHRFSKFSEMTDEGAEYVALFPNVLLVLHNDHYFNIILTPDGTGRTNEQIEFHYADEAVLGED